MSRARSVIAGVAIVLVAGSLAYWNWPQGSNAVPSRPASAPIPVNVAPVGRKDVPITLTGLGTVQASLSVAIHAQVEGVLDEVLFTEGQQVKKGDVLARIEPRLFLAALGQAKAKKAQDVALLIAAEKDLNRLTALAKRTIVSTQDVEQQQAKFDQLKAAVAADEAAMETVQTQLDYTTIRAPNAGRVGIRLIDAGNLVRASDTSAITTLVVTHPIAVLFTLPAGNLDDVRAALARGAVDVIALDQDNLRVLSTGRLLLIDNAIDASTSTIRLKAMFENSDDRLWPGEFINARVLTETRRNALTIPTSAVQRGPKGLFTWLVSATKTVEPRPIRIGPATAGQTIVTEGLNDGDCVVTDGQFKLQANARVIAAAPAVPISEAAK